MLVVDDIEKSKHFYRSVLGLRVISDFGGENISFTGGVSLQSKASWYEISHNAIDKITYGGNDLEIYFEEDDFDSYIEKLSLLKDINYVHNVLVSSWGQRSVRFYDLDKHIIEVAEPLNAVCRRLMNEGLSIEVIAKKTYLPVKLIQSYLK